MDKTTGNHFTTFLKKFWQCTDKKEKESMKSHEHLHLEKQHIKKKIPHIHSKFYEAEHIIFYFFLFYCFQKLYLLIEILHHSGTKYNDQMRLKSNTLLESAQDMSGESWTLQLTLKNTSLI